MPEILPIEEFLVRANDRTVVDVRTRAEFIAGHIPGAVNVPLFSDEERAEVGTLYVQNGREDALLRGLSFVGSRMEMLARRLLELDSTSSGGLLIHCWRGGMRSSSVAWLAELAGIRVAILEGGYKSFRRHVLESFTCRRKIRVVAGYTGSGKTSILHALAERGETVIDLEALAHHKGSAFGDLGEEPQPSQEQFENELGIRWMAIDPEQPLWLEDESRAVGRSILPPGVWESKRAGHFEVIVLSPEARTERLLEMYAGFETGELEARVERISRRLGGERTASALKALREGRLDETCRIVLQYYDKAYQHCLDSIPLERQHLHKFDTFDPSHIAEVILSPESAPIPR